MQTTNARLYRNVLPYCFFLIFSISLFSCHKKQPDLTGSYTLQQQVFSLNILSNMGASFNGKGNLQDSATVAINKILRDTGIQKFLGNWKVVWGPVVNVHKDTARNAMFIAQKASTDTFVVAIAGTDAVSLYEWVFEDFDVIPVPWDPLHIKEKGLVSGGTMTGFLTLDKMVSGGVTAKDFLVNQARTFKNAQIWVTGHSLGGALSPAYALYLRDNMTKWVPGSQAVINCLPVAGATPGDSTFNAYYKQQMGATTTRVWNTRDLIPHGFETDLLERVPYMYGDSVPPMPAYLVTVVNDLAKKTAPLHYTQLHPADSFTSAIYTRDTLPKMPKPDTSFLAQVLYQHIPAYGVYFDILTFQQGVQRVLNLKAPYFTEGAVLAGIISRGRE
ncbi:MAG: hypothetical protein ABW019_10915 [Chitinophagaceae bacterium]